MELVLAWVTMLILRLVVAWVRLLLFAFVVGFMYEMELKYSGVPNNRGGGSNYRGDGKYVGN